MYFELSPKYRLRIEEKDNLLFLGVEYLFYITNSNKDCWERGHRIGIPKSIIRPLINALEKYEKLLVLL